MHVLPLSRVFRRHSLRLPTAAALDEEGLKIGAALAWISHHGNLDDFPGSRNERLALMTTAIRRGFAAWDRGHDRYRLTKLGKMQAAYNLPNIKWANAPAQDSPGAKSDLRVRLLDRFESRPYTMIGAFFAIGVAVGAAVAWAPSSGSGDTRARLPASSEASSDSAAPVVSNNVSAPDSPVPMPQARPEAARMPAPSVAPAPPARDEALGTGGAPDSMAHQPQAAVPTPPAAAREEERAPTAAMSGSVAATRAIGHFDGGPSANLAEQSASTTKLPDSATPEPKAAPETQLKPGSHPRGHGARTQHAGGGERAPSWSQEADDGVRSMSPPHARRGSDVAEESIEQPPPRYRQYRNVPPYADRETRPAGDDPMGLVGWLFR